MPPLTRWYIKSALLYLIAGLLIALLQAGPAVARVPVIAAAGPAQVHLLVVGWVTQMIFGVAYWMFPKYALDTPRGNNAVAVVTFALLNVGLLLRVVAEPLHTVHPSATLGWLLAAAALAQWLAAIGFAANTWPRVKVK